ncbi:MAG: hypothetical protein ACKPKF_01935, partial [Microcystis panniformis]
VGRLPAIKAEDRISSPPDFWLLTFLTAPPDGRFPPVPRFPYHNVEKKSTSKVVDIGKKKKI